MSARACTSGTRRRSLGPHGTGGRAASLFLFLSLSLSSFLFLRPQYTGGFEPNTDGHQLSQRLRDGQGEGGHAGTRERTDGRRQTDRQIPKHGGRDFVADGPSRTGRERRRRDEHSQQAGSKYRAPARVLLTAPCKAAGRCGNSLRPVRRSSLVARRGPPLWNSLSKRLGSPACTARRNRRRRRAAPRRRRFLRAAGGPGSASHRGSLPARRADGVVTLPHHAPPPQAGRPLQRGAAGGCRPGRPAS